MTHTTFTRTIDVIRKVTANARVTSTAFGTTYRISSKQYAWLAGVYKQESGNPFINCAAVSVTAPNGEHFGWDMRAKNPSLEVTVYSAAEMAQFKASVK